MKTLLYSVFILLLAPCNGSKKTAKTVETVVNDNSKVLITFQRTPCFGKCPTYILTINGETKTATFKGEQNTEKIGTYTKRVSDAELTQLVAEFEKAKFYSLNDNYLGEITDFPSQITGYSNKGKAKKIEDRSGGPAELLLLEKMLDDFTNSEGWKKVE
ncbi:MAG: hypothetical protein H0W84_09825 [Bacteroidetes bacterium]|nr:hypothetical protein [Bacteroidota bacterium]